MATAQPLRTAIIGAGEVAQVVHLPVLQHLANLFTVSHICDVSPTLTELVAKKYGIPHHTTDPEVIFNDPSIDLVMILTSDAYHAPYAISALNQGKHVFVEKPFTLSLKSAQRVLDAERSAPNGAKVFVGYMRRYAPSFTQAFLAEISTIPRILYARSRDFSGPNAYFVDGSGTFPVRLPADQAKIPAEKTQEMARLTEQLVREATGYDVTTADKPVPEDLTKLVRFLNTLGSHDISLMREVLGLPTRVAGVTAHDPFYSAIFEYDDQPPALRASTSGSDLPPPPPSKRSGGGFSCTYESGVDGVPDFDAHLAVYGERKRVEIRYDTPFVKGLAIKVKVTEVNARGEVQTREMVSSYEDAYTVQLKEVYACFRGGKEIKTSARDACGELEIFDLVVRRFVQDRGLG